MALLALLTLSCFVFLFLQSVQPISKVLTIQKLELESANHWTDGKETMTTERWHRAFATPHVTTSVQTVTHQNFQTALESPLPQFEEKSAAAYLDELLVPESWELNNTARAGAQILFFNRVPKVGSQTLIELLRRLSKISHFGLHTEQAKRLGAISLTREKQQALAESIAALSPPASYSEHVAHINFTSYGYQTPIYINMVRDPVERVISWFYYVRAPWYYVERKRVFPDLPLPDPAWLRKDFETCVLTGDRECTFIEGETNENSGDHRRQILFFCGHESICAPFNSLEALQRAKRVVEEQYAVVGVLEDMNATLIALERYVPRFFSGGFSLYWDEQNTFDRINRNAFKPPVSEAVKQLVRANFTRELAFYEFCRQRLHLQLRALRDPSVIF